MRSMKNLSRYWPILALYLLSAALAAFSVQFNQHPDYMSHFMGFVIVLFGLSKVGDISGFAKGFAKYDPIARKSSIYAKTYPFLEILLGILFIGQLFVLPTTLITFVIYSASLWGALHSVKKGQKLQCVCLGTFIALPLSTVTLLEAVFMIGMCIWMLFMLFLMPGMVM